MADWGGCGGGAWNEEDIFFLFSVEGEFKISDSVGGVLVERIGFRGEEGLQKYGNVN